MAPFEDRFPVSDLEDRVHLVSKDYKIKSRKLPMDFNMVRDCPLYELVQYCCTSQDEVEERGLLAAGGAKGMRTGIECFPFVRLFRECKIGNQDFRVETTAWEGRHRWVPGPKRRAMDESKRTEEGESKSRAVAETETKGFAKYGESFSWLR